MKKLLAAVSLIGLLLIPSATVYAVDAGAKDAVCSGISITQASDTPAPGTNAKPDCSAGGSGITTLIRVAVNILSLIVGIAAILMIMIGGFKYVTSQGDSNNTASAKNTIMYALIGLAIVGLAQLLVRFTLHTADTATSPCTPPQTVQANGTCG